MILILRVSKAGYEWRVFKQDATAYEALFPYAIT